MLLLHNVWTQGSPKHEIVQVYFQEVEWNKAITE